MFERCIIHIDMDAFFASVEQRDCLELKGKPIIVGADPHAGRGVVSTCSYEARKYGIRSGMPITQAHKLCPFGIFLPVNMSKYQEASLQIREIFNKYTPLVEPLSLDEAFLDVTGTSKLWGSPIKLAKKIQQEIAETTCLTASVGISYNKFLAKLASDLKKPEGFVIINKDNFREIVWPLPVSKIWGVGPKMQEHLENVNIKTIGELAMQSPAQLEEWFGNHARQLHFLANGIDDRQVEPNQEIKSIGREITFNKDIDDIIILKGYLQELCEDVGMKLRANGMKAKSLTVKLRYGDFTTCTRGITCKNYLQNDMELIRTACRLFEKNWSASPLRLIGISVSNLEENAVEQLCFFKDEKEDAISQTMDRIKSKYGPESIKRCNSLDVVFSKKKGGI